MAGFIRGIDPRDNVYTYAHAAGRHFRKRATKPTLPVVSLHINKQGVKVQSTYIPIPARKRTARDFGLAPIILTEK